MARSYIEIQRQIDGLRLEAEKAKLRERGGVISRIKEAITAYELTPQELFGEPQKRGRKVTAVKAPVRVPGPKRAPSQPKFKDPDSGKTWTGMGKKPNWFKMALETGKMPADLAI